MSPKSPPEPSSLLLSVETRLTQRLGGGPWRKHRLGDSVPSPGLHAVTHVPTIVKEPGGSVRTEEESEPRSRGAVCPSRETEIRRGERGGGAQVRGPWPPGWAGGALTDVNSAKRPGWMMISPPASKINREWCVDAPRCPLPSPGPHAGWGREI